MATRIKYFVYGCFCFLLFAGATSAYDMLASHFEKRNLAHEHGVVYDRRSVPMLMPDAVGALPPPTSTQEAAMP